MGSQPNCYTVVLFLLLLQPQWQHKPSTTQPQYNLNTADGLDIKMTVCTNLIHTHTHTHTCTHIFTHTYTYENIHSHKHKQCLINTNTHSHTYTLYDHHCGGIQQLENKVLKISKESFGRTKHTFIFSSFKCPYHLMGGGGHQRFGQRPI